MTAARYPIAGLEASEAGIYGRFGYGAATVWHSLTIDRRAARFHAEDIPAVLEARSYAADVSVVLDISDDVLGYGF